LCVRGGSRRAHLAADEYDHPAKVFCVRCRAAAERGSGHALAVAASVATVAAVAAFFACLGGGAASSLLVSITATGRLHAAVFVAAAAFGTDGTFAFGAALMGTAATVGAEALGPSSLSSCSHGARSMPEARNSHASKWSSS
jgi:hypothetical protein